MSSRKSENLYSFRLVLSKAYKVLDEKVQKRHLRMIQRIILILLIMVILEKYTFLRDATDLKQSVGVSGMSVLDEIHILVNQYNFPLYLVS